MLSRSLPHRRFAAVVAALLLVTACGSDDDAANGASTVPNTTPDTTPQTSPDTSAPSEFPRTVSSKLGDAEIPAEPTRVAALGWTDIDVAVALGVTPTMITATDVNDGIYPWVIEALGDQPLPEAVDMLSGIPVELIAEADPDLILATNTFLEDAYTKLIEIAPVVSYVEDPWGEDWRAHARQIAIGLGREDELDALLVDLDAEVAAIAAANPDFAGKTFTFTAHREDGFDLIDKPDTPVVQFMEQLGFVLQPAIVDPNSPYSRQLSLENVELVDADVVVMWSDDRAGLEADPLWRAVPAVAAGHVIFIDDILAQALNSPTPLSIPYTIDHLLEGFQAATSD